MPPIFKVNSITAPSDIFAESPARFNILFSENIEWNKPVKVICSIAEPIFSLVLTFNVMLKKNILNPKSGYVELIFPESLGGASLNISLLTESKQTGHTPHASTLNVDILSQKINLTSGIFNRTKEVTKVLWTAEQFPAFDVYFPEKKTIFKNEYAFLHVHTRGMYGKEVFVELREYDNEKDIRPIKSEDPNSGKRTSTKKYKIRNNVLSIPYSMETVLADFKKDYWTITEGANLELYTRVSLTANDINKGIKSEILLLALKGESSDPVELITTNVKTTIDEEDLDRIIKTNADCAFEFRPQDSYKGDYGFDWIRKGDTKALAGDPFNDNGFDMIMGKYCVGGLTVQSNGNSHDGTFVYDSSLSNAVIRFSGTNGRTNDIDDSFRGDKMYKRLIRAYTQLVFKWKDVMLGAPFRTFTPIMTFLIRDKDGNITPTIAKLDMYYDIKKVPEKVVLEFNNRKAETYLEVKPKEFTGFAEGINNSISKAVNKFEIKCIGEFQDEYTLFARAFGKNDLKGQICGMIRIHPNAEMYHRKIKVVCIRLKTNINGTVPVTGVIPNSGTQKLKNILKQAFIIPEIDDKPIIDLTIPSLNFKSRFCTQKGGAIGPFFIDRTDPTKSPLLKDFLLERLEALPTGTMYDDYFKIFYFAENASTNTAGYSRGEKFTVCFKTIAGDDALAIHELLHSLDLPHTFDGHSNFSKFTYEYVQTNNIMDYSDIVAPYTVPYSLYYWQWQILNNKIK